jgi:hypothetical protein
MRSHGRFFFGRRGKELCEIVTSPWYSVKPGMYSVRDPLLLIPGTNSVSLSDTVAKTVICEKVNSKTATWPHRWPFWYTAIKVKDRFLPFDYFHATQAVRKFPEQR